MYKNENENLERGIALFLSTSTKYYALLNYFLFLFLSIFLGED